MSYERRYLPIGRGIGSATLTEISDITITGAADDEILQYNSSTGKWENVAGVLNAFTDVNISGPATGDTLYYDGSQWVVNPNFATNISNPTDGDILYYETGTGQWTNIPLESLLEDPDVDVDAGYPNQLGHAGI